MLTQVSTQQSARLDLTSGRVMEVMMALLLVSFNALRYHLRPQALTTMTSAG
jgi:hypothetical protein